MPRSRLELQRSLFRIAIILALFGGLVYLFTHARQGDTVSGAQGVVNANALYLKSGPGELYERLGSYKRGAQLKLVGRAPGDGWYFVRAADGATGWLSALYLDLKGNYESLPRLEIADALVVRGVVHSSDGVPGDRVRLKFSPVGDEHDVWMEVVSTAGGEFYFYLPKQTAGEWRLVIEGLDCASRLMDKNCVMSEYFPLNFDQQISLPPAGELEVVYQKASLWISGTVRDAGGKPQNRAWVFAQRADGAVSGQPSDEQGAFRLPAGAGEWQLRARIGETKSELMEFTLEDGVQPGPVELRLP